MTSLARLLGLCALGLLTQPVRSISLTVNPEGGNVSSPILYGFMFEDINHSGDGGIHGQLLRNNGFQGDSPNLTAYGAVGDVTLAVDFDNPLSAAITRSLRVDVPTGTEGQVGFSNEGYWGIPVDGSTFTSHFFLKGKYSGDVTIKLVGTSSGIEYGTSTFHVDGSDQFTSFNTSFPTARAPDGDVIYTLTFDGADAAGDSLWFDLIQLYPTTYKNRSNGLKTQIADALDAVQGSFLRFPGGNNLEGASESNRWKWNETIGPLEDRPGREGDWSYPNTDALGLDEYFYWSQDLGLEPVLGVWAGFSLDSGGNTPITGEALQPYIDDILDELEYILGDASSKYGAWRVANNPDHQDPWPLKMVEIGNEDNLGGGCESYPERFQRFHDAIKAKYPQLTIISSNANSTCLPDPMPEGAWMDYHNYNLPEDFYNEFNFFDNVDRSHPYFIGEYSRWEIDWPNIQGSVSEAIWMLGIERNSDVVKMAAYAPTLNLVNSTQWTPDLIAFDQSPDGIFLSTSYYVQQLFSVNRGDTIKEVTSDSDFGPVFWAASSKGSTYYVKMANYGQDVQSIDITIPGKTTATLTVVTNDDPNAYNSDEQHPVSPVTSTVVGAGKFSFTLPAWAVAVLAAN